MSESRVEPDESVRACNLCARDADDAVLIRDIDRYGYSTRWWQCPCGLVFLNPRMTKEAYAEFYASGAYRRLVSAFHGREINAETMREEQEEYGEMVGRIISARTDGYGASLLDVGGSTGVVAGSVCARLEYHPRVVTILDPAVAELERVAFERIPGTIEDFDPADRTWDLVTMCQTADHLLDLMGSLKKILGLLSPGGLFWSDIVDFDVTREVKIDHPFNLTERTYRMFLEKAGFKLLQVNYAEDGKHVGFLTRADG